MSPRRALALVGALAVTLVLTASPALAQTPNTSILLYRPGYAETGTFVGGIYTQKRKPALGTVTHAAASRDTLALYDTATGRLRTGQFRKGVYTPIRTITIRAGYTHVIASCDSVLFYDRRTGKAMSAVLTGGTLGERHTFRLSTVWRKMIASCDTTWFQGVRPPEQPSSAGTRLQGTLVGGVWTQGFYAPDAPQDLRIVATEEGYVALRSGCSPWCGTWGQLVGGGVDADGSATDFSTWDKLAGTAESVLFYNTTGDSGFATLSGGSYSFAGTGLMPKHLTILAGGK